MVILVAYISIVASFVLTPGYHGYHSYLNCTQTLERSFMDSRDKGTQGIPLSSVSASPKHLSLGRF
jgi:hypothetical protein